MRAVSAIEAEPGDSLVRQRAGNTKVAPEFRPVATPLAVTRINSVELHQCESSERVVLIHVNADRVLGDDNLRWFVSELALEARDFLRPKRATQRHQVQLAFEKRRQAFRAAAALNVEFHVGIQHRKFGGPTVNQDGDETAAAARKFAAELREVLVLTVSGGQFDNVLFVQQ